MTHPKGQWKLVPSASSGPTVPEAVDLTLRTRPMACWCCAVERGSQERWERGTPALVAIGLGYEPSMRLRGEVLI